MELLASWPGKFIRYGKVVFWQERNAQTFEGCKRLVHDLYLLFLKTLFE